MSSEILIARFGKTYGIHGWIKINSYTTPVEKVLEYDCWLIKQDAQWVPLNLEAKKLHGNSIIAKIKGYDNPESVKYFTNQEIAVAKEQLQQLPENEYYWSDLIGLTVVNLQGVVLGTVQELMGTGVNDVLVVTGDRRRLIPYLSQVVIAVELGKKQITVDWGEDF
jgi:16S rRNA processing protein RimM